MRKSPSYCVSGVAEGANGPAALSFRIEPLQPSSGSSSRGGVYVLAPGGITDKDGRFRICDLFPGTYRLHADDSLPGSRPDRLPVFGAVEVTVADEDIRDVRVTAAPGLPLEGEVVLEGAQPDKPPAGKVSVWLQPLLRAQYRAESTNTRSDIPGRFSLPSLLIDDYAALPRLNAPGLYIKDVSYGGRSVRYEPLRMGSAMSGAGLKILVAQDGATLSARVAQKDGAPVADARVLIMPVTVASEGMLAAALVSGKTDQSGQYTSSTLAPGKYYVAASLEEFDPTPESMGRLWRAHHRFQEVELAPKGSAQVNLEPLSIER
ncbi:MAG: carboxypeptidase regulatory-like domain-containing protein [Bryobacterales bacterium]|nr:carboxypeptidase regulatory-like domain-containing protein [Bryobacterales bacterium]